MREKIGRAHPDGMDGAVLREERGGWCDVAEPNENVWRRTL
jgi:hypothetical protein